MINNKPADATHNPLRRLLLPLQYGKSDNIVPRVEPQVYEALPGHVKPLNRHWLRRDVGATV